MQQITGPGIVFLEIDGSDYTYTLRPGEKADRRYRKRSNDRFDLFDRCGDRLKA